MPFLTRDEIKIYFESTGNSDERAPIIFAHGAGGNAAIWYNQVAHFSESRQVVCFDHRSFGRSTLPPEPILINDFRDDVLALMDHLSIDRAHLVGQSMGGFTALRTTLDAPERVLSLTLSATSGGIVNPAPTDALKNLSTGDDNDTSGVKATMSAATLKNPAKVHLYAAINNFNVEFAWSNLRNLLGKEGVVELESLSSIRQPVLFVAGDEDPLFPQNQLASYVPHFPDARIETVLDAGHSPYFEQPDRFNDLLETHLQTAEVRTE